MCKARVIRDTLRCQAPAGQDHGIVQHHGNTLIAFFYNRALETQDVDIDEDALALIEIDYEPLPAVADARRALEADAPLSHVEFRTNVAGRMVSKGSLVPPGRRRSQDGAALASAF